MGERGDIILHGLLRLVAGLVLSGLVMFEAGAVALNRVHVDGAAQGAARAGAHAWNAHGDQSRTEDAARASAGKIQGVIVRELSVEPDALVVTVSRPAPVLLIDRLRFLEGRLVADATASVALDR